MTAPVVLAAETAGSVLQPYWWIAVASAAVSAAATPLMRWLALRWKIQDLPDGLLKTHKKPVAYLGGVAVFLGWVAGLLLGVLPLIRQCEAGTGLHLARALWIITGLAAGGLVAMLTGLLDDLRDISPRLKLLGQLLAAVVLLAAGVGHRFAAALLHPLAFLGVPLPDRLILLLSLPLACFLVIAASNAANLLDGLDGLCTGVSGIIALGFFGVALRHAVFEHDVTTDPVRMVVVLSMLGAVLGFLPYNFNPASIFLGDAGSVLLGFFAAAMMLLFADEGQMRWLIGAALIFGLPIFDTAMAFVRRVINHKAIFAGDRSHFYDQLIDRGLTVVQSVLISYGLALVFVSLGLGLTFVRTVVATPVFAAVVLLAAFFAWRLGFVQRELPSQAPQAEGRDGKLDE